MVIEIIFNYIVNTISKLGYYGIFFFMTLESMIFPIPAEAVMPFAGFLVAQGKLNFYTVLLFSSLASLAGSLISYYIGFFGGRRFVRRFGKYFLLGEKSLKDTEKFFNRYGEKTIFIGRFVPIVRHLISIPAGIGKMNLFKFSFYTVIGAAIYNTFLLYLGFILNDKWLIIEKYSSKIDIFIVIIIVAIVLYYFYNLYRKINFKIAI